MTIKTNVYTIADEKNKVITKPDLQFSTGKHLGTKSTSVKFDLQVPHRVPVLPVSQESILLQLSLF